MTTAVSPTHDNHQTHARHHIERMLQLGGLARKIETRYATGAEGIEATGRQAERIGETGGDEIGTGRKPDRAAGRSGTRPDAGSRLP